MPHGWSCPSPAHTPLPWQPDTDCGGHTLPRGVGRGGPPCRPAQTEAASGTGRPESPWVSHVSATPSQAQSSPRAEAETLVAHPSGAGSLQGRRRWTTYYGRRTPRARAGGSSAHRGGLGCHVSGACARPAWAATGPSHSGLGWDSSSHRVGRRQLKWEAGEGGEGGSSGSPPPTPAGSAGAPTAGIRGPGRAGLPGNGARGPTGCGSQPPPPRASTAHPDPVPSPRAHPELSHQGTSPI